ncbi:MAG: DUF2752 domain-containing protein [Fulvivirga sp.]
MKTLIRLIRKNSEAIIWLLALIALASMEPTAEHASLCPLANLGWEFCPGCGLGHSIAFIFRGDFEASFAAHPLGLPALIMLVFRISTLVVNQNVKLKINRK